MTMKSPDQIAEEVAGSYFDTYQDSAEEVGHPEGQPIVETWPALRGCIAAAIEADRAQRGHYDNLTTVYVVQSEDGDIYDLTDNHEYAEWLTRQNDDNPIRTYVKETVWSGPENRKDW